MIQDLLITSNNRIMDISIAENGDIATTDGFDTAILMSIFVDARADISEVPIPENRRGWWGDLVSDIPDESTGSKIWLYYQARLTTIIANKLEDELYNCLLWFVKDNYLESITTSVSIIDDAVVLNFGLKRNNSETESRSYTLWQNTTTGTLQT